MKQLQAYVAAMRLSGSADGAAAQPHPPGGDTERAPTRPVIDVTGTPRLAGTRRVAWGGADMTSLKITVTFDAEGARRMRVDTIASEDAKGDAKNTEKAEEMAKPSDDGCKNVEKDCDESASAGQATSRSDSAATSEGGSASTMSSVEMARGSTPHTPTFHGVSLTTPASGSRGRRSRCRGGVAMVTTPSVAANASAALSDLSFHLDEVFASPVFVSPGHAIVSDNTEIHHTISFERDFSSVSEPHIDETRSSVAESFGEDTSHSVLWTDESCVRKGLEFPSGVSPDDRAKRSGDASQSNPCSAEAVTKVLQVRDPIGPTGDAGSQSPARRSLLSQSLGELNVTTPLQACAATSTPVHSGAAKTGTLSHSRWVLVPVPVSCDRDSIFAVRNPVMTSNEHDGIRTEFRVTGKEYPLRFQVVC